MASTSQPQVFFLSLEFKDFLDECYASLVDSISNSTTIERAKNASSALRYLQNNNPKVIIITDKGLTIPANKPVFDKVTAYIENGGSVIVGLHFCNFTNKPAFDKFFLNFGLPWQSGDCHRTTFGFNKSFTLPAGINKSSFPQAYSMKVLHVKNAHVAQKIFIPIPGAKTQSMVLPPAFVDQSQAAVVGAKIGKGYLYYCGDVNPEAESEKVILTLCGL